MFLSQVSFDLKLCSYRSENFRMVAVMICGGNAGERRSLTIFCSGNAVPLEKTQGWGTSSPLSKTKTGDAVVDHRDKNRQNKPAVGRYFL